MLRNWQATAYIAVLVSGCGTPGVTYSDVLNGPASSESEVGALIDAAGNKAVVVNVPISRILVEVTAPAPGGTAQNTEGQPVRLAMLSPTAGASQIRVAATEPKKLATGTPGGSEETNNAQSGASVVSKTIVGAKGIKYKVSVVPIASDMSLRMTPVNDFFSANKLGVTKLQGTDIPTVVNNEFTDLTAARIADVGNIVSAGLGLVGLMSSPGGEGATCPAVLPTTTIDATVSELDGGFHPAVVLPGGRNCWVYRLVVEGRQADIVDRKAFHTAAIGRTLRVWPVQSCLDAKLQFFSEKPQAGDENPDVAIDVQIIDPAAVRLIGIPDKGKIAMHPVCNADVTDSPIDRWATVFGVIDALEVQAKFYSKGKIKTGSK